VKINVKQGSVIIEHVWVLHCAEGVVVLDVQTNSLAPQSTSIWNNMPKGVIGLVIEPSGREIREACGEVGEGTDIYFDLNSVWDDTEGPIDNVTETINHGLFIIFFKTGPDRWRPADAVWSREE
jgi:hypothetical protein